MKREQILEEIVKKQDEIIAFYGKNIDSNACFLEIHGMGASGKEVKQGKKLRKELASLKSQLAEAGEGVALDQYGYPLTKANNRVAAGEEKKPTCDTCKYKTLSWLDEPCCHCYDGEKWESR